MLGGGLAGQGDKNALHLLPFLHDQARVDFPDRLEQHVSVLGRMLETIDSIFKLFQVAITGMFRMTSRARYFKEGVGSSRPHWRWLMCFWERLQANTSWKAVAKRVSFSCGAADDTNSSRTSTRHSTGPCARRLPTVYAGSLLLS
jgi:hypothetical protein